MTIEAKARAGRRLSRRWVVVLALILVVLLMAGGAIGWQWERRDSTVPLFHSTLAIGEGGKVVEFSIGDEKRLLPGTRVLADVPGAEERAQEQRAWLTAGTIPAAPEFRGSDLTRNALLDLHVLSTGAPAPLAGWSPPWDNIWPRDSAFAAAALARTGHLADAERILTFLAQAQNAQGEFQARYRRDGSIPDDRGVQLDGTGWSLWALEQVVDTVPTADQPDLIRRYQGLLDSSATAVDRLTRHGRALPPVSPDYWEITESKPTLATAAVLLTGIESAERLYRHVDQADRSRDAARVVKGLRTVIRNEFGPDHYPRYLGGRAKTADLGVGFLLPPFSDRSPDDVVTAWKGSESEMTRPAGGLAPGGSWRRNGVSWTPATATYALVAAANGERQTAIRLLQWIEDHRTGAGSIPEKVLADGTPASVAPLGWSSAAVILTVLELGTA